MGRGRCRQDSVSSEPLSRRSYRVCTAGDGGEGAVQAGLGQLGAAQQTLVAGLHGGGWGGAGAGRTRSARSRSADARSGSARRGMGGGGGAGRTRSARSRSADARTGSARRGMGEVPVQAGLGQLGAAQQTLVAGLHGGGWGGGGAGRTRSARSRSADARSGSARRGMGGGRGRCRQDSVSSEPLSRRS